MKISHLQLNNINNPASKPYDVNFVKTDDKRKNNFHQPTQQRKKCGRCGYDYPHKDNKCPADGKTCSTCNKLNHFAKVCRQGQAPNRQPNKYNANGRSSSFNNNSFNKSSNNKKVYNINTQNDVDANDEHDHAIYKKFVQWMHNEMVDDTSATNSNAQTN